MATGAKRWFNTYNIRQQYIVKPLSRNTDGSFIMGFFNLFWSPYQIPSIAQENKYLGKFSYFIMKLYVVCTQ